MPSLFDRRVYASKAARVGDRVIEVPNFPGVPSQPREGGVGPSIALESKGPSWRVRRTSRMRTIPPPPPTQVHVTAHEFAWIDRYFGGLEDFDLSEEFGRIEAVRGDGVAGGDDGGVRAEEDGARGGDV